MSTVWLNGRLVDERAASVSVYDRGFTLGDGLFETMRAYGGHVFRLEAHLERLASGAERIGLPLPDGLAVAVRSTLAASGLADAALRLTISRGLGGRGVALPVTVIPTVTVTAHPFEPEARWYADGIHAVISKNRINEHAATAGLKCLGYLGAVLASEEARAKGADDALLLDTAGHLAEGAASNLFLVRGDVLYTPPLSCGILPGITRATVIGIAAGMGIAAREDPLPPEAVCDADEAFLTSSLRELVPLTQIDGRPVGGGRPGPLTRRLLDAYRDLAHKEALE